MKKRVKKSLVLSLVFLLTPLSFSHANSLADLTAKAEQGDAVSQYELGLQNEKTDYYEAMKWYRKASMQGCAPAQMRLGVLIIRYDNKSQREDREAVMWFRKAAEQGDRAAQYFLGLMYVEPRGTAQDFGESVKWFQKSADQGNTFAQAALGLAYYAGKGIDLDYSKAYFWMKLSGTTNPVFVSHRDDAKRQLLPQEVWDLDKKIEEWRPIVHPPSASTVVCAQEDTNVAVRVDADAAIQKGDFKRALNLLLPLAEQGDAEAQLKVGIFYFNGEGVKQDYAEAAKWLLPSAEQGNQLAQGQIGTQYSQGWGVKADHAEAYFWLSMASKAGHPISGLTSLSSKVETYYLTNEQIMGLDKRIADWRPSSSPIPVKIHN